jgi:cytochrome P450
LRRLSAEDAEELHRISNAPLARVEGQVTFATLFRRFPELRAEVPDEEIHWGGGSFLRGFTRLPVLF